MGGELSDQVRQYVPHWHAYEKKVSEFERLADQDPAAEAQDTYKQIDTALQVYGRFLLEHFGIEVQPIWEINAKDRRRVVVDSIRKSVGIILDVTEGAEVCTSKPQARFGTSTSLGHIREDGLVALRMSYLLMSTGMSMIAAELRAIENGEDPNRAACEVFLGMLRMVGPAIWGMQSTRSTIAQAEKQKAVVKLAGWIASKISLSTAKTLKASLAAETNGSPFKQLLQELPSATLIEWSEGNEEKGIETIVRRVSRSLTREGPEPKAAPLEETNPSSEDLFAEFEAKESARQELHRLRSQVKLSELEEAVLRLDLQGYETKDVASKLNRAKSTVRGVRKRYRDKLRKLVA